VACGVLLPGYAPGVDPQQHGDAAPRPLGYLRRWDARVQPRGDAGMAEVVGPMSER
jgi:hypothetical protein